MNQNAISTAELAGILGGSVKSLKDILSQKAIPVTRGHVSRDDLPKLFEPNTWVLSTSKGLGAVKAALDECNVLIREHIFARAQFLTIEGPTGRRKFVQMYYRGKESYRGACAFDIRGFMRDTAPSHYLFVCFQDNTFWAISRAELRRRFEALQNLPYNHYDEDRFYIPYGYEEHSYGALKRCFITDDDYSLSVSGQLGV